MLQVFTERDYYQKRQSIAAESLNRIRAKSARKKIQKNKKKA